MLQLLINWKQKLLFDMVIVLWKKATHLLAVRIDYIFLIKSNFSCIYLGNYNEQLRIIDFPVYVSGKDDTNLTRLVPRD